MMGKSQITKAAKDAEKLFKMIMGLYSTYLDELETYIKNIPDTDTEVLYELNQHMVEVQDAIEHDIGVFEVAIQYDTENLHKLQDKLKIDTIYKTLKRK